MPTCTFCHEEPARPGDSHGYCWRCARYFAARDRSWAAERAFAEVLTRHGFDAAQLPAEPPLTDRGLCAAYHEALAAAQQTLDEPLSKYL